MTGYVEWRLPPGIFSRPAPPLSDPLPQANNNWPKEPVPSPDVMKPIADLVSPDWPVRCVARPQEFKIHSGDSESDVPLPRYQSGMPFPVLPPPPPPPPQVSPGPPIPLDAGDMEPPRPVNLGRPVIFGTVEFIDV